MINSRNDIIELLDEYMVTQREYEYQFGGPEADEWSGKKQADYAYGTVLGKFREQDTLTLKVMKEGVTDQALYEEIKIYLENKIKEFENIENLDLINEKKLESYKIEKDNLIKSSTNLIDDWIKENCKWTQEYVGRRSCSEIRVLIYLYYSFDNYSYQTKHPFCSEVNELEAVYDKVLNKNSQFYKYGIIPVSDDRELILIDSPRIYDKTIDKTFFIKNVPLNLLKKISNMMSRGIVKDFSVRLFNEPGFNGRMDSEYIAEVLERGQVFDFVNLGDYSISKLYSKEYENCMWVVIDAQNITFEELCEDIDEYDNMIVTQVVHLQYDIQGECVYITHLDHEYIFYTLDEYENRMNNVTQKGTAKQRMKSFKIDNSKIPFSYRCEVLRKDEDGNNLPHEDEQFLCYVLECYFKHKDLLKEYFQKIL